MDKQMDDPITRCPWPNKMNPINFQCQVHNGRVRNYTGEHDRYFICDLAAIMFEMALN